MGFLDKVKGYILGPEDDADYGDVNNSYDNETEEYDFLNSSNTFEEPRPSFNEYSRDRGEKVVDFRSANEPKSSKPHVVVAKLERFEDVGEVTKSINEKRIVIINLESASNEVTQRIIDFIYGVTIANKGELKRVAYRTYMIKPMGYDYTGSLDEDSDSNSIDGIFFR